MKRCANVLIQLLTLAFGAWLNAPVLHAAESASPPTLPQVAFSVPRGFCDGPTTIELRSPTDHVVIRYTVDGSDPSLTNGQTYAAPLRVTNTTMLRAAMFKNGERISVIGTHSYLFLDDALRQSPAPHGFPAGRAAWSGQPSAYQMDPRVVNDLAYRDRLKDALRSLPIVSMVCCREDMFGPRGLYLNSMERGSEWERRCSVEMILTNGESAFQIDCGMRVQGNMNRVPARSPKHAFRLLFKASYGPGKLHYQVFPDSPVTRFDTLVLRADYNNSWIHWDPEQAARGQRIRDAWMKDSARAMGWLSSHSRYVHLFLNGLYWGVYDFTERPDANFAAAYLGGKKEDYDVLNEDEVKGGTSDAFKALASLRDLGHSERYQQLQQHMDVTNYIDFLLLNFYAGNLDWGENKNCYLIRRRLPAAPFQYFIWDGEHILNDPHDDVVDNREDELLPLATQLIGNPEFRRAFSVRAQKHCFGDGALTAAASLRRWMSRAAEVDRAMIAESARWGYHRRNPPFTRDDHYLAEQRRLVMLYFPQRTWVLKNQLKKAGLYIAFPPGQHSPVTAKP
ncbi:MAG TPA: CotH kinase family protein [Candidatus Acidoferrum sp.]|nr:CotH kinase family protein [Candidatus Acidoferrum sp.]